MWGVVYLTRTRLASAVSAFSLIDILCCYTIYIHCMKDRNIHQAQIIINHRNLVLNSANAYLMHMQALSQNTDIHWVFLQHQFSVIHKKV